MPKLDKGGVYKLITDSSTFGSVLIAIALNELGSKALEIDPLELFLEFKDRFGEDLTQSGENRLQAMTLAMTSDDWLYNPSIMDSICKSLATGDPDIGSPDASPLTVGEITWAIYELGIVLEREIVFGPLVQHYIESVYEDASTEDANLIIEDLGMSLAERRELLHKQFKTAGFDVPALPPL